MEAPNPSARIFFVEDDPDLRDTYIELMELEGHSVVLTAGSLAQALPLIPGKLIEQEVSLTVLDHRLPDGFGEAIAKKIRETMDGLPIISFSADNVAWGDINVRKLDGIPSLRLAMQQTIALKKTK